MEIFFFKQRNHANRFVQFTECSSAKLLLSCLQLLPQFGIFLAQFMHHFISNPVDARQLRSQCLEFSASMPIQQNGRYLCGPGDQFSRKICLCVSLLVKMGHERQELLSSLLSFHSLCHDFSFSNPCLRAFKR